MFAIFVILVINRKLSSEVSVLLHNCSQTNESLLAKEPIFCFVLFYFDNGDMFRNDILAKNAANHKSRS